MDQLNLPDHILTTFREIMEYQKRIIPMGFIPVVSLYSIKNFALLKVFLLPSGLASSALSGKTWPTKDRKKCHETRPHSCYYDPEKQRRDQTC